ncbi:putative MFS-type transporter [Lachnellula willkommii]|uniref:Putative MFS-type transporter n=1 Tax=Lachnellula willkommii TaxID=215461 RepID=A0A559MHU0_9HELO|nr:putative MFS-type transporter [Lachnellula willkommii]
MGGALILPNAVAMIGITFPPGRSRNFCLGIFGAAAPVGGYLGAVLAGIFTKFTPWWGLFLFLGLLAFVTSTVLWKLLPHEKPVDVHGRVDWIGAALGTTGLVLFNFTWNQAPAAGWGNPYQIGILVGSVVTLAVFAAWELYSPAPIMPLSIWKAPSFLPLMLSVLMSFMSFGVSKPTIRSTSSLCHLADVRRTDSAMVPGCLGPVGPQLTPFLFFGVFAAWWASWLIPRLPAQYTLAIGLLSVAISNVLIATMPAKQTYWAQVFPATILMSFCPDLVFTAAQIIASNAVSRADQGVAASLIGVLLLYGNSIGLGFAGTIEMQVSKVNEDSLLGYRSALWFGCGIALLALVLDLLFVRMEKDDREGWDDEEDYDDEDRAVASGVELQV